MLLFYILTIISLHHKLEPKGVQCCCRDEEEEKEEKEQIPDRLLVFSLQLFNSLHGGAFPVNLTLILKQAVLSDK